MKKLCVEADQDRLDDALEFLDEVLEGSVCDKKTKYKLIMVMEEIFVNIASYAYEDGSGTVELTAETEGDRLTLSFIDSGTPFDPLAKEDPDIHLAAKDRRPGGMGILMVKNTMDDVAYQYKDGKNIFTIIKNLREE